MTFPLTATRRENGEVVPKGKDQGESEQKLEGNCVNRGEKEKATWNGCEKLKGYLFIWFFIIMWLYYKYCELTHIGKTDMYSTIYCTLNAEHELDCRVHMQNNAPASVEECGDKNKYRFCGKS